MKGYKATDKDMKCSGFQYELGKWYEHEGELIECQSGFHFCEYPSGVWAYYGGEGVRVFEVEAEGVLDKSPEPGADVKRVCKRIKLVREIEIAGDGNAGNRNTGNRNTGYWNTGYWNTGDGNTGYWNTGDGNAGNRNTGNRNTGDGNAGNRNTGNRNTGDGNAGNRNTGDGNTGDGNTGDGNATDRSSGFFCVKEPKVVVFDVQTNLTYEQFTDRYPEYCDLCRELMGTEPINFERYSRIPGITKRKLTVLHKKHMEGRKK